MDAGVGDGNGICFPNEVLLDILRRLPGGAIAACQCVCRGWRDIIDVQQLSLERYFPRRAFPGIFVTKIGCHSVSAFFGPPSSSSSSSSSGQRPVLPQGWAKVHHACNGLLLLRDCEGYYVYNPATVRSSEHLPRPPMPPTHHAGTMFLAFDPAVSLHYEVFVFQEEEVPPDVPEPPTWVNLEWTYDTRLFREEGQLSEEEEQDDNMDMEQTCLPKVIGEEQGDDQDDKTENNKEQFGFPSESDELEEKSLMSPSTSGLPIEESLSARSEQGEVSPLEQLQEEGFEEPKEKVVTFTVYSSRTGRWENREFTPGCCAPGHLYDVVTTSPGNYKQTVWSSEYWRKSLYMHCHNSVLMILRPSKGTYDMVELPGEPCGAKGFCSLPTKSVLASYERGIHYVVINQLQLQVWMLDKSTDGQLGWTLSQEVSLEPHCHMVDPLTVQPRMAWVVVESSEDRLISLSEDSNCGESICGEENYENSMTEDENYDGVDEEDGDEAAELGSRGGSEDSWDSDEDNFIDLVEGTTHFGPPAWGGRCNIMGFHPHKCALILQLMQAVVVYHLDTSRIQYLGDEYELIKDNEQEACVYGSFPYRPCYVDVLPAPKPSRSS